MFKVILCAIVFSNLVWASAYQCTVKKTKVSCKNKYVTGKVQGYLDIFNQKNYLYEYLKGYVYKGRHGAWKSYKSKVAKDVNEVLIKRYKNSDRVQIKKASGTIRMTMNYKRIAKHKVINKLSYSAYEGIQSIKSNLELYYKIAGLKVRVSKIIIKGTQSLGHRELAKGKKSAREFDEKVIIKYK